MVKNPDKLASGFILYKKHILRLIREAGHRTVTAKVMEHAGVFLQDTLTKVSLAAGLTGAEVIGRRRRRISI